MTAAGVALMAAGAIVTAVFWHSTSHRHAPAPQLRTFEGLVGIEVLVNPNHPGEAAGAGPHAHAGRPPAPLTGRPVLWWLAPFKSSSGMGAEAISKLASATIGAVHACARLRARVRTWGVGGKGM